MSVFKIISCFAVIHFYISILQCSVLKYGLNCSCMPFMYHFTLYYILSHSAYSFSYIDCMPTLHTLIDLASYFLLVLVCLEV